MTDKAPVRPAPVGLNLSVADVYFIIFRQKWKIMGVLLLAIVAAALLPVVRPVLYQSEAKLYVRYVLESRSPTQVEGNDSTIRSPDNRGESLISTELEILTSLDLAQQVVNSIGADKILGPKEAGDRDGAAAVLRKNLTAEVQKNSSVIRLTFKHGNAEIVQPVLAQYIELYFKKHTEMHAVGAFDPFLTQKTEELRSALLQTERELQKAKTNAGVISVGDAKKFQSEQVSRLREAILEAEAELAEHKIVANELAGAMHGSATAANPANDVAMLSSDTIAQYSRIATMLEMLRKKQESDALVYTPESLMLKRTQQQIEDYLALRQKLELDNPGLKAASTLASRRGEGGAAPRDDLITELARVTALDARLETLRIQLEKIRKEAATLAEAEGTITELQSRRDLAEAQYRRFVESLEQSRIIEQLGSGKVMNISTIQKPSAPFPDSSKINKARLGILFAGLAAALAWAFLFELFLDTSVKRPNEIESKIGLPLFLTIPLLGPSDDKRLLTRFSRFKRLRHRTSIALPPSTESSLDSGNLTLDSTPTPSHNAATAASALPLTLFFDALRDRLINFFEVKNLTRKPKLVAITSCCEGSGVSTVASGLASSLSETGDGNVLLVDMNQDHGITRHHQDGRVDCGLDTALEVDKREAALVSGHLYFVSESGVGKSNGHGECAGNDRAESSHNNPSTRATNGSELNGGINANGHAILANKSSRVLPKRFNTLVPKLKASDYDYVIFDMPPISQVSITPRIAKHMDMVLLVVEAEKTEIDVVKRATAFLSESKPNLGAILNKRRTYVPKLLRQEL